MPLALYSIQAPTAIPLGPVGYPSRGQTWQGGPLALTGPGTHLGLIYQGAATLSRRSIGDSSQRSPSFELTGGMYFCLPGAGQLEGQSCSGLIITCPTYQGMFSLGGPLEAHGRLAYIDGGTSSLLIPPVLMGDPCRSPGFSRRRGGHCRNPRDQDPDHSRGYLLDFSPSATPLLHG
jgi:hypothetical protein